MIFLTEKNTKTAIVALLSVKYRQKLYEVLDSQTIENCANACLVNYEDVYGMVGLKTGREGDPTYETNVLHMFQLEENKIIKQFEKDLPRVYPHDRLQFPHLHRQRLWYMIDESLEGGYF